MTPEEAVHIYRKGEQYTVAVLLEMDRLLRETLEKIKMLEEKIQVLESRIEKLSTPATALSTPSAHIPPYQKPPGKKRRKRPGRKKGHRGEFRRGPQHIDERQEHTLQECPDCHQKLKDPIGQREQIVEDIPPVRPKVVAHIVYRYECSHCHRLYEAPMDAALPKAQLGLEFSVQTVFMHYGLGLTVRKINQWLERVANLQVSPGGLALHWQRVAERLRPVYDRLREEARNSPVLHADESGWRVKGRTAWLWCFTHARLAVFLLAPSRAAWVLKEVLGAEFKGTLITDFFAAYGCIQVWARQRCLVHLLREIKEVSLRNGSPEWQGFARSTKRLIRDALHLAMRRKHLAERDYQSKVAGLHIRLANLYGSVYGDRDATRLANRLCRYDRELFTFLLQPGVSADNNHAERQIRSAVVMRKNSYGNHSWSGAETQAILMSIIRTCQLRHIEPLQFLRDSLRASICTGSPLFIPPAVDIVEKAA